MTQIGLPKVRIVIAMVVVTVWVASLIYRSFRPGIAPEFASVDSAIVLVLGYLFMSGAFPRKRQP